MRVHKSFIISLSKIQSISGNRIYIHQQEIPVGEMYKLALKQKIQ
jgi:DNA-binding LytR/AlgR family response regulator